MYDKEGVSMKIRSSNLPQINAQQIYDALSYSKDIILQKLPLFTEQFQSAYSENSFYQPVENHDWSSGFWTGQILIAYEFSKDKQLKDVAELQIDSFKTRIDQKIFLDNHDLGFIYSPSCVAAYKLTGNKKARTTALKAADHLISRFQPLGEFIQAWGKMDDPNNYSLIIEGLMNLPLLYWAHEETKEEKYKTIADKHLDTTLSHVIREDYSTWHTYYFDRETGAAKQGSPSRLYKNAYTWARGHAFGIYGIALAYRYTRKPELIDIFRKVTSYYLNNLPENLIPYWDLRFRDGDQEPRDSSAATIACCGILEMIKYLELSEASAYIKLVKQCLKSLFTYYAAKDPAFTNGIIYHGTYSKQPFGETKESIVVDECTSWGDYFYMEAMIRLHKPWKVYW